MSTYAVAWRDQDGPLIAGKLELGTKGLRLEAGRHRDGRVSVLSLLYRDVTRAEMAPVGKRLSDRPTVALTAATRGLLYIAPVGMGVAREVLDLLQLADSGPVLA
jgi:hypothetical protein